MPQPQWGKVESIAKYADVSKRTVEKWLRNGLNCSHPSTGLRLIKFQWVDEYLEKFAVSENRVDEMVNQVIAKVRSS